MNESITVSRIWISTGRLLLMNVRLGCSVSGSVSDRDIALLCIIMMVVGLEFSLCWVKQDLGSVGINLSINITNFVGYLTGNFVRHYANNNFLD